MDFGAHPFSVQTFDADDGGIWRNFSSQEGDSWSLSGQMLTLRRPHLRLIFPAHAWFGLAIPTP
jgi:hypothetical protein